MICLLYIDCTAKRLQIPIPWLFSTGFWEELDAHITTSCPWMDSSLEAGDFLITGPYSVPPFLQCFLGAQTHSVLYVVGVHFMYCVTLTISFSVFGSADFSLRLHQAETWSLFLSSLWGFLIHHQISLFLPEYSSQTSILFTCTIHFVF